MQLTAPEFIIMYYVQRIGKNHFHLLSRQPPELRHALNRPADEKFVGAVRCEYSENLESRF